MQMIDAGAGSVTLTARNAPGSGGMSEALFGFDPVEDFDGIALPEVRVVLE